MTQQVDFAHEARFARWLALPSARDDRPALPIGKITSLSVDHRIVGRVVQRLLDDANPSIAVKALLADLSIAHAEIVKHYIQVTNVIEDLSGRIGRDGTQLIVLNGFTTYYITRNPFHIRSCEANRILTPPEAVIESLLDKLSPIQEVVPISHGGGSFFFRGIRFNAHWALSLRASGADGLLSRAASRARTPKSYRASDEIGVIGFDDLIYQCENLYSDGTVNVFTPRAHAAVFMKIADFYQNFVKTNTSMPVGKTRFSLHSLFEIADLLAAPSFDAEDFNVLCERFKTKHQNLAMGQLIHSILGIRTSLLQ